MSSIAEVRLWGTRIGAVFLRDGEEVAEFQYSDEFLKSGIELSPLVMPLSDRVYRFPILPRGTFHGRPGLLADSLPDRFGNALIDAWLARQGRSAGSFNAVERLCYTGKRGMGALEFVPSTGPDARQAERIEVEDLVRLASQVLQERESLCVSFPGDKNGCQTDGPPGSAEGSGHDDEALLQILRVGTSAGGARAKAVIAWNPQTRELRSGQLDAPQGFEHWLIKFDGVTSNRDRELDDPQGFCTVEYAYHLMARAAGIVMADCQLLPDHGRMHFMTRRFDRTAHGQKLHMQTLGALAHFDYNTAGIYSYEQAFATIRALDAGMGDVEQQYRRMVFNIMARNQDDHVKNISFLMDRSGRWALSPAYDLTFSYRPSGDWTGTHQMTVNGLRDGFGWGDLKAVAGVAGLKRGRAESITREVHDTVTRWPEFADAAGVAPAQRDAIFANLRLSSGLLP
ncbi:MAG: type II toxin-antitoxin system HipA family toxin [Spirochaetaceae bacterium]|nr:type II toxin-antitoxin system HipA family toxin [Spirochaetaceae bacterium]